MGMHIYLETAPESGLFNYHGEPGANGDPVGFKRVMARNGLRVIVRDQKLGNEVPGVPGRGLPSKEQAAGRDISLAKLEG